MSGGTAAAMLLADLLLERENPAAGLYDPGRLDVCTLPAFARKGAHDAARLVGDRLRGRPDVHELGELGSGEGRLIDVDSDTLAVSRDEDGRVHAVTATCTHLGCIVRFDNAEQSWDCPCHGSRFTPDGAVLQGPALARLGDARDRLAPGRQMNARVVVPDHVRQAHDADQHDQPPKGRPEGRAGNAMLCQVPGAAPRGW